MSHSLRHLTAVVVLFASCTSAGVKPSFTTTPIANGLIGVANYAQEFCSDGMPPHCPSGTVPASLRRQLEIPNITPGSPCPVTAPNPRIWSRLAPGLGPGPVAPVALGLHSQIQLRPFPGSVWEGQKVLWVAAPTYDGPVLIRGERVDGTGAVGFDLGGSPKPQAELQLPPGHANPNTNNGGYRNWPSYTRVRSPGCYAYQVDGTSFSYVIVFRAV